MYARLKNLGKFTGKILFSKGKGFNTIVLCNKLYAGCLTTNGKIDINHTFPWPTLTHYDILDCC